MHARPHNPIADALATGRLMICCGPGGVGKTTAAAALGLHAALSGRRVLVMTIDPARRLADAMGLSAARLGSTPSPVAIDAVAPGATPAPGGELWAMMLDARQTFEALITTLTPDSATAERIVQNRAYRATTHAMTGLQHYMAVGRLCELVESDRYDLIVLDTPPTRSALNFLAAPGLITRFFDRGVLRWFTPAPARRGLLGRLFNPGPLVHGLLSRALGEQFATDLGDFLADIQSAAEPFKARGQKVDRLLRAPETSFLIITGPDPQRVREALYLNDRLKELERAATAFVVNRVSPDLHHESLDTLARLSPDEFEEAIEALGLNGDAETLRHLLKELERYCDELTRSADRDRRAVQQLIEAVGRHLTRLVPSLDDTAHPTQHLMGIARHLTA